MAKKNTTSKLFDSYLKDPDATKEEIKKKLYSKAVEKIEEKKVKIGSIILRSQIQN